MTFVLQVRFSADVRVWLITKSLTSSAGNGGERLEEVEIREKNRLQTFFFLNPADESCQQCDSEVFEMRIETSILPENEQRRGGETEEDHRNMERPTFSLFIDTPSLQTRC